MKALVTGSSNGIGEAIAVRLAGLGHQLVVTGRSPEDVSRVARLCEEASPDKLKPLEVVADFSSEPDVERLFAESMAFFADELHLLVNNAGFGQPVSHLEPNSCYEAYKRIMQINMHASVRLTLLAAPVLEATARKLGKTSCVINMSSISATRPGSPLFAYGASKAAMNSFTEYMAWQLSPWVRVNAISPGPVTSKICERSGFPLELFQRHARETAPRQRCGEPEDVVEALLYLADPQRADFVTGSNLVVDGGFSLAPIVLK